MPAVPQGLIDADWLNLNSQRAYPLSEAASQTDTSGSLKLPADFLVDLVFPIQNDPTLDPTLFHVAAVGVFGAGVTVSLAYNGTVIANVTIDSTIHARNANYAVQGTGLFFDSLGRLTVGRLDTLLQSPGAWKFDLAGGRLEPRVIVPGVRGVSALYVKNGENVAGPYQGDIILQAGRNFQLTRVAGPGDEPDRLVLSAFDGTGLNASCDCNEAKTLPCIKTINSIGPKTNGDFDLLGDDCLELASLANGIQMTDKCAKPCCGCAELQVVTDAAQFFAAEIFKMETLVSRLEANIEVVKTNLLASKAGTTQ